MSADSETRWTCLRNAGSYFRKTLFTVFEKTRFQKSCSGAQRPRGTTRTDETRVLLSRASGGPSRDHCSDEGSSEQPQSRKTSR